MKITIYAAYHKESPLLKGDCFQPIHVGKEQSSVLIKGTIGDDTGDNISSLNGVYCEMTAMYWAWKNDNESDFIGLCHYRRILSLNKPAMEQLLLNKIRYIKYKIINFITDQPCNYLKFDEITCNTEQFLFNASLFNNEFKPNKDTIYVTRPVRMSGMNIQTFFSTELSVKSIHLLKQIIEEKYPHLYEIFLNSLDSNIIYYANLIIMPRIYFNNYCIFMFELLDIYMSKIKSDGYLNDPLSEKIFSRHMGYIAELISNLYIRNMLITKECKVSKLYVSFLK